MAAQGLAAEHLLSESDGQLIRQRVAGPAPPDADGTPPDHASDHSPAGPIEVVPVVDVDPVIDEVTEELADTSAQSSGEGTSHITAADYQCRRSDRISSQHQ